MRTIAALAAGALLLGACTNEDVEPVPLTDASPSPSPSPSASAEPGPDDPYAVPAEITPEYVEEVYAALAKLEAEAIEAYRAHVENGGAPDLPPKEAVDRFRAIYAGRYFATKMAAWSELAASGRGFSGFRNDLDRVYLVVEQIVHMSPQCVLVEGVLDVSGTAKEPGVELTSVVAFVPMQPEDQDLNPTPWELAFSQTARSFDFNETDPCSL